MKSWLDDTENFISEPTKRLVTNRTLYEQLWRGWLPEADRLELELIPPAIYHWQSHSGAEVDIILERDGTFYPIEVKLSSRPTKNDNTGITAFRKTYPNLKIAPGLIICPTENFLKISENDYALPWDTN